jgi:hypothetical protein
MASAAVMGIAAVAVVYAIGLTFLHTDMPADHLPALLGVTALGVAAFTTAGMAICSLVPRASAALASAYGTMLPITFISNVFFPGTGGPSWLKTMADAFPIAPVAKSAEQLFAPAVSAWPMTHTQLIVLVAWIGGASLVTAMAFRWEAGTTWLSRWLSGARRRFAAARA